MAGIRLSRFYNDPNIGRGFENIGKAFAPPDASDMLASAKAQEIRDKASRLAELYSDPNNPQFDRRATLLGLQTGSQSLEAVGLNNATTLTTNARDNAAKIQQENLRQRGDTDRAMLAPIGQDQARFVPKTIAEHYGTVPIQYGPASLAQGETVVRPDGTTLAGAPKPLTEAEVRGQVLAGLPKNEQRASALQGVPTDNVVTPDGPRIAFRADTVGLQPAATPVEPQSATNYRTPDGAEGTAVLRNGGLVDSQTQQPIPAGSRQFSTAVQGSKDETGLGTANVNKAGQRLLDMDLAEQAIDRHAELIRKNPGALGAIGGVARTMQNAIAAGGEAGEVLKKYDIDTQKLIADGRVSPDVIKRYSGFNPALPAVEASRQRLITLLAAAGSSDGNVSNKDVDRIEAQIGGSGMLNNDQDTLARLSETKAGLRASRDAIGRANPEAGRNFPGSAAAVPSVATKAPAAAGAEESWVRGPDGKLQRAR